MINNRALIVTISIIAAFVGLVIQLFAVQVGNHDKYKAKADRQQNTIYTVKAERGIIYDRNMEILAYTKDDVSLFADARMLNRSPRKRKKLAVALAKVFNRKPQRYINQIKRSKKNVCLEKKISKEKALLLNNLVVDGFYKVEDFTRIYPYGNITSHILGFVDNNSVGRAGLEKMYNDLLKGKDGKLDVENDVIGRTVSIDYDNSIPSIAGDSFILTLNKVYQKILVNELKAGIDKYKGKSGIGIIANPKTGEILALANIPDFNPKSYNKVSDFVRRNRALTDTYEPGSTMKSIVLSMMLEKGLVRESDVINTENGKYRIKGAWIRDTHKHKVLTVRGVLEQSSNVGIVKLSEKIDNRDFYKGLRDFGFGNLTSIDMLGETRGYLKKPNQFSGVSKAFISHGYEVSVTPIQMIMAYSALVNGGYLLEPRILKQIVDAKGNVKSEFETKKIRRVISQETSELIKNIMIGVVEHGTGTNAQLENVYVGGKTGTAQKLIKGRYSSKYYNSSFIGFFPAEDPEIICLILVDSPEIGRYGGQVAAPIFRNVAKKILDIDFDIKRNKNKIERNKLIDRFMAGVEKGNKEGDDITLMNYTEEKKTTKKKKILKNVMPNLKHKTLREAISILSDLNVKYKIEGHGRVVAQSIKRGTPLSKGMNCLIKCSSNNKVSLK
jgi:cell division protein FtsI/penicillin-binding protein 2